MEQLIQQLKVILGTNFALYLKSHNYHWNVEGPNFNDYHTFLGALYTAIWGNTDLIAEKIRMLGSYTPGSMERFLELADIEEAVDNIPTAQSMMQNLKYDNDRFIIHLRAGISGGEQYKPLESGGFYSLLLHDTSCCSHCDVQTQYYLKSK
jgi:starvation-inducible DNA-binding protein